MALCVEINGTPYRIFNDLDISVGQFVRVFSRTKNQPAQLTELQQLRANYESAESEEAKQIAQAELLETEDKLISSPAVLMYYLDIISLLSDIPRELLEQAPTKQFWQLLGLCNHLFAAAEKYSPSVPDKIHYKGEDWFLIKPSFENQDIASHIKAQMLSENAEHLAGGQYEAMLKMLPLLLHRDGQTVSLAEAEKLEGYFDELPLRDAIDIAFFLRRLQKIYQIRTATSSTAQLIAAHKKERRKGNLGGLYSLTP